MTVVDIGVVAMFIMSRFILGLGIPIAIIGASSLLGGMSWLSISLMKGYLDAALELSHPKERAIMGSLFNACWFIGKHHSI
jgi:hypothetical protein